MPRGATTVVKTRFSRCTRGLNGDLKTSFHNIPRFNSLAKNGLPGRGNAILVGEMIRGGFLDPAIRADLIALVRDGKAETRLTRRANALLLLDDGMSCEAGRVEEK